MKITIDTKEDSKDEIKRIIHMLSNLLERENKEVYVNKSNIFSDDNAAASNTNKEETEKVETAFGSIFNSPTSNTKEESSEETKEEDIKIDIPEIEEY